MDRWGRWRSRSLTSRADARRAGVTALALVVVTAALAVLLAVLFHLAWPPVLVSVVGTVPALYLAWLAVPGAPGQKKPAYGRRAAQWAPVELGVHRVIGAGPMPAYVRRPHDELLRAVLDPAVPASRLVVVRGASSTGKTRAAYEAVADRLAGWQLDYARDPAALNERLDAGIPARTVLWLGELRQYADADGGAKVLGRLADLLEGDGRLLITTVWPEQWTAYTAAARAGPGAAGTAGRLLEPLPELTGRDPAGIDPARGGVIDVPDQFAAADLEAAAGTGDPVLAEAAAAAAGAGQGGQVTQYLAGVPDLLERYERSGGDPYGQAVITAAMDAARLGHASPLPATLVQEAAVGYLTGPQRTKDIASWRDTALDWAAAELNGAVRALQPVPPPSGTGVVGYQVADYLDQHGRRTRQDQLGPPSLWDALVAHAASASDLTRLAQAARDRGLYRHAAALWTTAATLGSTDAARQLITHLRQVSPADTTRAARWAVGHASLDVSWAVAELLRELREAGASDAAAALLARDPAAHARLDDQWGVAMLLVALREAGAGDAAAALVARAAADGRDNPESVAMLLRELREDKADPAALRQMHELLTVGAGDAAAALLARDPASLARLDDPGVVAVLVEALRRAGADAAARALASRVAARRGLGGSEAVAVLVEALRGGRADHAALTLASRAAAHARLDNPEAVALFLWALREAGAGDAAAALLARDPAAHARLDDPWGVAMLLAALREAGAGDAAAALAARAAADACLDDPGGVAMLLREAGASDAAAALAARAAAHARLDDPWGVAELLRGLRTVGASDAVTALAARAANGGMFNLFLEVCLLEVCPDEASSYRFGREPDGAPSQSWRWQEPTSQPR